LRSDAAAAADLVVVKATGDELEDAAVTAARLTEARLSRPDDLVLQRRGAGDTQRERIGHQLNVVRVLVHCNQYTTIILHTTKS